MASIFINKREIPKAFSVVLNFLAKHDAHLIKLKYSFIKDENDHDANLVPFSVPWRFWEYSPPPSPKNLGIPRKMYEKERDIIPFKEKFGKKGKKTKSPLFFEKFVK